MISLAEFKNKIVQYGIIAALICEVVSLFFLGWNPGFTYGLALGTAISIVNFTMMEVTLRRVLSTGNRWMASLGYLIRLLFYGVAFYSAIKIGIVSAVGVLIGFMTLKVAIFYLHGIKAKYSTGRVVREEPKELIPKKHWYDDKENEESED